MTREQVGAGEVETLEDGRPLGGVHPGSTGQLPPLPSLVVGQVRHQRRAPIRHTVHMRTHLWLVDLDDLPARPQQGFRAADHFSGAGASIRDQLLGYAATQGESVGPDDRLLMLAAPRSVGHVFNPLSVHWCLGPDGRVRFAVLEIHNTYGERHAHLVRLDPAERARVAKQFYVSPFFAVAGAYRVRLQLQAHRVTVAIVLEDEAGQPVFTAAFRGTPRPATARARLTAFLRTPLAGHQTSARIRWHGLRLWARLPVQPRPAHVPPWVGQPGRSSSHPADSIPADPAPAGPTQPPTTNELSRS